MSYKDRIRELSLKVPKDIVSDFNQQRKRSKPPTQAFSEFLTNREQGDWAEGLVFNAINKVNKHFVAVQYGRSDRLVAGEAGFKEFYESYQDELDRIGKRPDILVFKVQDYKPDWNFNISNLPEDEQMAIVPNAIAGLEIRSSSFLVEKYDLHLQQKATSAKKTTQREFLSFTPKVEDIIIVYKWIQTFNVPHFYFQVFFDKVYGISFENILELIADPANRNTKYFIEKDEKNQQKTTIKINVKEGIEIASKVDMPSHQSDFRELNRGRLLFYVKFEGGEAYLNTENLFRLLNLPRRE
ncbi:MAG: AccI family restriction endonuclease [Chloroflexota bacterium]